MESRRPIREASGTFLIVRGRVLDLGGEPEMRERRRSGRQDQAAGRGTLEPDVMLGVV